MNAPGYGPGPGGAPGRGAPFQTGPIPTGPTGPIPTGPTAPIPVVPAPPTPTGRAARGAVLVPLGAGALVAIALGVYGRLHEPTFFAVNVAGFSSGVAAKAWLATAAFVLALVQLASALVLYGRFPRITAPSWTGTLHRWSGRVAVLLTIPVALHCLYALGFEYGAPRVLAHSLFGCLFYGAFVAKMLTLTRPAAPRMNLPVLGGVLFTALVALWLTASVWFFATTGITF